MTDYLLGIEVLSNELKIAGFKRVNTGYKLYILDRIKSDNIKDWVLNHCPHANRIQGYLTITESQVYFKEITLPQVSGRQLHHAINWEVRANSPLPIDQAIYDSQIIRSSKTQVEVLVMFVQNTLIDDLFEQIQTAGIQVRTIEPAALALTRIIKVDSSLNTLLVSVEKDETNVLVLQGGYPTFTTSLSVSISPDEANKRRLNESIILDLAQNTQKTIDYWQTKTKKTIGQVIVSGDISQRYYGLATAIYNLTKIPAFAAKPKKRLHTDTQIPKVYLSRYYTAIGAGLRFEDSTTTLNFLPLKEKQKLKETQKEAKTLKIFAVCLGVGFILFLIVSGLLGFQLFQSRDLTRQIDQTRRFVQNHPAQSYLNEAARLSLILDSVNSLMALQKDVGQKLTQINSIKPNPIKLTSINFTELDKELYTLQGTGDRNDILSFYDAAIASLSAQAVTMPYSNLQQDKAGNFELQITWP